MISPESFWAYLIAFTFIIALPLAILAVINARRVTGLPRFSFTAVALIFIGIAGFLYGFGYGAVIISGWPVRVTESFRVRPSLWMIAIGYLVSIGALWHGNISAFRLRKSEHKRIKEKARLDYLTRDYLMMITHELKTPISSIYGYAGMIRTEVIPSSLQELIDGIYRGTARLRVIIGFHDALIKPMDIEPFDFNLAIREYVMMENNEELWAGTRHYPGAVYIVPEPTPLMVEADRVKLITAVSELVRNALKVSEAGAIITVGGKRLNGDFVITVADNGGGVPEEDHDRIFQRGVQLRKSINNRPHEGSGFGLYVVGEVARMHGGAVIVDSDMGAGSVFSIRLPRYRV